MLATAVTTQYLLTVFFCWVKGRWHRNNKNHPISLDRFLLLGEREAVWLGPIIIWENGGPQFKAWIVLCKPFVEKSMKRRLFLHSPPPRMILLNYPNVIDFVFLTFCMFFFLFFFQLLAHFWSCDPPWPSAHWRKFYGISEHFICSCSYCHY